MSLPSSIYNSLLYTYKAAVLDNWHDFSTPYKYTFGQIADLLQPLYDPLDFKSTEIPKTTRPVKPPLPAFPTPGYNKQQNIGEGVSNLTTYGCPWAFDSPVASDNEDIFLAQLGIIKDSAHDSPTYGMRIINTNPRKCWEGPDGFPPYPPGVPPPPSPAGAETLASTHYIDFTAKRMAIRQDKQPGAAPNPSVSDINRFREGEYVDVNNDKIGSSAFGDLMKTICTDGTYSLVADTIQKGFQWQIKQFYSRENPWGPKPTNVEEGRKGRLVWTDCAETAFDPALKSYGPGEGSESASATSAGVELGLTHHKKKT